ncbi:MAG: signal peptide peptidase SppA [Candidatus Bilamarchaeaceae archaeon]
MNSTSARRRLIFGTIVLLVVGFLLVVMGFVLLSYLAPLITGKCVAEVVIDYPLTIDGSPETLVSSGYPSSEELAARIRELNTREDVGAVLFVINTGGGSVIATREIYDAIKELKKPKVAYFRETAASGGYYIATGTDYIVSEPYAITGNIGVVATVVSMESLFEKIGVNVTSVTSGVHKDMGSPYRNMTEEEIKIMESIILEVFEDFKSVVQHNRAGKLKIARFNEITDGRILSGKQALEAGLVDQLGNKNDAIMKAAELGGITAKKPEDVRICKIEVKPQGATLLSAETMLKSIGEYYQSIGVFMR